MLAIKIWNYLKGYVIIRIKGLTLERLLNLALSKDIYLWNVNRINSRYGCFRRNNKQIWL